MAICYLVGYAWQTTLTKNISRWSAIAFYLAVIINSLVALFYPFDKGSKYIGWHHLDYPTVDIYSCLCRWCHYADVYCHLVAVVTVTDFTTGRTEALAYPCRRYHHSMYHPLYHHTRDTANTMVTRLHTSQQ